MKYIIIGIILSGGLVFCLSGCGNKLTTHEEQSISEKIMKCWENSYETQGVNLSKELEDFESILISENYLKNTTYKGYKNLYLELSKDSFPRLKISHDVLPCLRASKKVVLECNDSVLFKKIKFFSETDALMAESLSYGKLAPQYIFAGLSNMINQENFKSELIKTWLQLNLMVLSADLSNAIKEMLPKSNPKPISLEGVEFIVLESIEKIKYKNKEYDITEFSTAIKHAKEEENIYKIVITVNTEICVSDIVKIMNVCRQNGIKPELNTQNKKN